MNKMKSYFIHLKFAYKLCMFLIMPVLVVGLELLCAVGLDFSGIAYSLAIMVVFEVICDYFSFGGIYSKEGTVQNFYKTSPRGKEVYFDVFLIHGIRRALMIVGFTVFCVLLELLIEVDFISGLDSISNYFVWVLLMVMGAYAWSVIASFACRKLDMVMVTWGDWNLGINICINFKSGWYVESHSNKDYSIGGVNTDCIGGDFIFGMV